MELYQHLDIHPGICALVGSGGKTTTMLQLARQLPGTVIVCTTTHIMRPALPLYTGADPIMAAAMLAHHRIICVGSATDQGKLTASPLAIQTLAALADYVLVEADGSRRLPMKAHMPHEPVIPPEADRVLMLVGASGFGQPARECVHRLEEFCALAQTDSPDTPVTPSHVARVIAAEHFCDTVIVNQVESPVDLANAKMLASLLPQYPVFAAAIKKNYCERL